MKNCDVIERILSIYIYTSDVKLTYKAKQLHTLEMGGYNGGL